MRRILPLLLALALLLCGCREAVEEPPAPPPPPPQTSDGLTVRADWSRLETDVSAGGDFRRYGDRRTEDLILEDDYGPLLFYAGERFVGSYGEGSYQYRYGLTTADGQIVTEPVYDSVWRFQEEGRSALLLRRAVGAGAEATIQVGLAALDGSWYTGTDYIDCFALTEGFALLDADQNVWHCDGQGVLTQVPMEQPLPQILFHTWQSYSGVPQCGVALLPAYDGVGGWLVNFVSGQQTYLPDVTYADFYGGDQWGTARLTDGPTGYIDRDGNWTIAPQFGSAEPFQGDFARVQTQPYGPWQWIDRQGNVVQTAHGNAAHLWDGETIYYLDMDITMKLTAIYNGAMEPVNHPALGQRILADWPNLAWADEAGQMWCWWEGKAWKLPSDRELREVDVQGGQAVLGGGEPFCRGVYDLETQQWIMEPAEAASIECSADTATGDLYYKSYTYENNEHWVVDQAGTRLLQAVQFDGPIDGVISVRQGDWTGLIRTDGTWVMRLRVADNGD